MSPGPLVSREMVREHSRRADLHWESAQQGLDPYELRLRNFAEAADGEAKALRLAELGEVAWKPRADGIVLGVGLRPSAHREGPPALWKAFDRCVDALSEAAKGNSTRAVAEAFEALRDATIEIAAALEKVAAAEREAETG